MTQRAGIRHGARSTTTTRSTTGSGRAAIAHHLSTRARRPITITGHLVTASAGLATRHLAARDIPPDHPGTITRTSPLLHAATRATSPPPHEFPSPAAFISLSRPVRPISRPHLPFPIVIIMHIYILHFRGSPSAPLYSTLIPFAFHPSSHLARWISPIFPFCTFSNSHFPLPRRSQARFDCLLCC